MSFDSEDEYTPLQYGTPSPYKKRRLPELPSLNIILKNKEVDYKIQEIEKLTEEYNSRILENINERINKKRQLRDEQQKEIFYSMIVSPSENKKFKHTLKDIIIPTISSTQSFNTYFSPDCYFNKFSQDLLVQPSYCLQENFFFGELTATEVIQLINIGALNPNDFPEKNNLIKFLLYFGSVTMDKVITGRISQVLERSSISFSDFNIIIENWGRVKQETTSPKECGMPQSHNFEFIIHKVISSVNQYTLVEVKYVLVFLFNVSLDPLFIGLGHVLLQPLQTCVEQLLQRNVKVNEIVDLLDFKEWNIISSLHFMTLLLSSDVPEQITSLIGFKAFTNWLTKQTEPITSINMETLFNVLKINEEKLMALDFSIVYPLFLLFELLSNIVPQSPEFDKWQVINYMEMLKGKFHSEIKAIYLSKIINRMKFKWSNE